MDYMIADPFHARFDVKFKQFSQWCVGGKGKLGPVIFTCNFLTFIFLTLIQ